MRCVPVDGHGRAGVGPWCPDGDGRYDLIWIGVGMDLERTVVAE